MAESGMFTIKKSTLFMQQWKSHAQYYKSSVNMNTAERFIVAVDETLNFIAQNPYACNLYDTGEGYDDLHMYQFRKWNLHGFPHKVLFRMDDNSTILIEVLYADKMDIPKHLSDTFYKK